MTTIPPPIVLLHGAGEDARKWDAWLPLLAPREVIAPSLPGRAGVAGPPLRTAAEAAAFVAEQLSARGVSRFVVVGHSYGGAVALELALGFPERVAGLALISTGARLRVHPRILDAVARGLDESGTAPWSRATPVETALADWRAADAFDRLGAPLDVRCPTLVVVGELDVLTPPKYARYLATHIAGAKLVEVPGAGHDLPDASPELVAPLVAALG